MKKDPFPQTKDEKFLLGVARKAYHEQNDIMGLVEWKSVAHELNLGEKSCQNIVNILAKTYLIQKSGEVDSQCS